MHVSVHKNRVPGGAGGGGLGGGDMMRAPQSEQSEPSGQSLYCEPEPPSSHAPSESQLQTFSLSWQTPPGGTGEGEGEGEGAGGIVRTPQSTQSVPSGQRANSEPGPPSSQSLSEMYHEQGPNSSSMQAPGAEGGIGMSVQSPRSYSQMAVLQLSSQLPSPRIATAQPHVGTVIGGESGSGGGIGGSGAQSPPSNWHSAELQLKLDQTTSHMPSPIHAAGHVHPEAVVAGGGEALQSPPSKLHSSVLQSQVPHTSQ